jgi:polysaccharide export outer membrane protein
MATPRLLRLAALATAVAVAACGGSRPAPVPLTPVGLTGDSAFVLPLRPGDVIRVTVFQHGDVSGDFPIDENWKLVLPMIGEIDVRNMTVPDLRARIRSEMSQLYSRSFITVVPLFRVAVLGEVTRPNLYSVDPTMTIYDVLALAGGTTRDAKMAEMRLIRTGQQVPAPVDAAALAAATLRELGVRSGDQLIVPRRFWTYEMWIIGLQLVNTALLAYTIFR